MKEILKKYKYIVILIVIVLIFVLIYFIREYMASKEIYTESYLNGEEYIMNPKKYGVNEYSPMNISDEKMANIYLNDFKNNIFNDINYAYSLLNEEYRNLKFGSVENFINYVNGLDYSDIKVDSYSINKKKNTITVYTEKGNEYIFKIFSVMEYEVYLDDSTVEI